MVHRYDPTAGAWVAKPPSAGRASAVDSVAGVLYAETSSFSLYSALAAPALPAASTTAEAETTPGAAGTPVVDESTWLRDVIIIASASGGVALLVFCLCAVWIYRNPPRRAKVQLKQPPTPAPPQAAGLEGLHPGAPAGGMHPAAHPAMQESGAARMATAGPAVAPADLEVSLPPQHQARPRPTHAPAPRPPPPCHPAWAADSSGAPAGRRRAPGGQSGPRDRLLLPALAAPAAARRRGRRAQLGPFALRPPVAPALRPGSAPPARPPAPCPPPARPLPAPARAPARAGC